MKIPTDLYPFLTAGATKILMEGVYDAAFKTDLASKIQKQGMVSKGAMTLTLGIFSFFIFRKIKDDNFFKNVIKEVGVDSWSEIGKRLFNGFHDLVADLEKTAKTPEEKDTIGSLRKLGPQSFDELLREFLKTVDLEKIRPEIKRAGPSPSATPESAASGLEKATAMLKRRRETLRKIREGR